MEGIRRARTCASGAGFSGVMHFVDLKRNDVEAAVAYYVEKRAARTLKDWQVSMLLKLQDDPTELLKRLREVNEAGEPDDG